MTSLKREMFNFIKEEMPDLLYRCPYCDFECVDVGRDNCQNCGMPVEYEEYEEEE